MMSEAHKMAILFGEARLTLIAIRGGNVRLGIEVPKNVAYSAGRVVFQAVDGSVAAPARTGRQAQRLHSTAVAKILSSAGRLHAPAELEELTAGLLSLRAKRARASGIG